jgi:phenylacetate-CoA ligase
MIWQPEFETLPRDELEALQLFNLKRTVRRVYSNVPFYREKMDSMGVKPEDIRSLEDVPHPVMMMPQSYKKPLPNGLMNALN